MLNIHVCVSVWVYGTIYILYKRFKHNKLSLTDPINHPTISTLCIASVDNHFPPTQRLWASLPAHQAAHNTEQHHQKHGQQGAAQPGNPHSMGTRCLQMATITEMYLIG